jgi:hypothetical protein
MLARNGSGPAPCDGRDEAGIELEVGTPALFSCTPKNAQAPVCAELLGSDTCKAAGVTARGPSPVLALCRELIGAGFDPSRQLHVYRGETACLRVRSIGEAARLEINSKCTGFVKRPSGAVRTASPIDWRDGQATTLAVGAQT